MEEAYEKVTQNHIWEEMCKGYCYSQQLRIYTDVRRKWNRRANGVIIIGSVFSFIFACINISWATAIAASMTAIVALLKEVMPLFLQPERDLNVLDDEATFFYQYYVAMEKLYIELRCKEISAKEAEELFFNQKKSSAKHMTETSRYFRGLSEKEISKCNKEFENRIQRNYNTSDNE